MVQRRRATLVNNLPRDREIVVNGYDDRVEIKGKKIAITNFFNWLKKGH